MDSLRLKRRSGMSFATHSDEAMRRLENAWLKQAIFSPTFFWGN
jgi:hypothetical protein